MRVLVRWTFVILALVAVGFLVQAIRTRLDELGEAGAGPMGGGRRPAAVEVAPIERGPIEWRRVLTGTLEARSRVAVAANVGGRIERLTVDLSDPVRRHAVVAELDSDEFRHAVAQADAGLAVAQANLGAAHARLKIARRGLDRVKKLRTQGIATDTEFDRAEAEFETGSAAVAVAEAQVLRANAALAAARTRLDYTKVAADWSDAGDVRYVARRFVEVGDTVAANMPLVSIVELDPIEAAVFVTEADYGWLQVGQTAIVRIDALPEREFPASISRISPEFRSTSRQARVELSVRNSERLLKPGMFVSVTVILRRVEEADIVPASALVRRGGATGVFLLNESEGVVAWHEVQIGIRQGERVQVVGLESRGRVVTLGHQLIDDGSAVVVPEAPEPSE